MQCAIYTKPPLLGPDIFPWPGDSLHERCDDALAYVNEHIARLVQWCIAENTGVAISRAALTNFNHTRITANEPYAHDIAANKRILEPRPCILAACRAPYSMGWEIRRHDSTTTEIAVWTKVRNCQRPMNYFIDNNSVLCLSSSQQLAWSSACRPSVFVGLPIYPRTPPPPASDDRPTR